MVLALTVIGNACSPLVQVGRMVSFVEIQGQVLPCPHEHLTSDVVNKDVWAVTAGRRGGEERGGVEMKEGRGRERGR